jgi:hypothetical protein
LKADWAMGRPSDSRSDRAGSSPASAALRMAPTGCGRAPPAHTVAGTALIRALCGPGEAGCSRRSSKPKTRVRSPRSARVVRHALVAQRQRHGVEDADGPGSSPGEGTVSWAGCWCTVSPCKPDVRGSTPRRSTLETVRHTLVAQGKEHDVPSVEAAGSSPAGGTAIHSGRSQAGAGCPAAFHSGGEPGSTPGPVTDPSGAQANGYFGGSNPSAPTNSGANGDPTYMAWEHRAPLRSRKVHSAGCPVRRLRLLRLPIERLRVRVPPAARAAVAQMAELSPRPT